MYKVLGTNHSTIIRHLERKQYYEHRLDLCLRLVDDYRLEHPGGGLVKIYEYLRYVALAPELIDISRERFVAGMKARGRILKLSAPRPRTTVSGHHRFVNRTRGLLIDGLDQLWVSDTTYYRMKSEVWFYLTFIIDVFSRRIIGFAASDSLATDANIEALQMAIDIRGARLITRQEMKLIFHSDAGRQYSAKEFLECLKIVEADSSMGFVAQENAYAERVNGIIKGEFLKHWPVSRRSISKLKLSLARAVNNYNTLRIHNSLPGRICPSKFEDEYTKGNRCGYATTVKEWNHNPYISTDKFTGTNPNAES